MPPSRPKPQSSRPPLWQERLLVLTTQAFAHLPNYRITEAMMSLTPGGLTVEEGSDIFTTLQIFAIDLALFTAPAGRSTAVERLAKKLHLPPASEDGRAMAGLLKARFAVFELTGRAQDGVLPARDLVSGQPLRVEDMQLATLTTPAGYRFAARLAPIGERAVVTGATIPIDDATLDVLRPWQNRDRSGWSQPGRAAEALYRHILGRVTAPAPERSAAARREDASMPRPRDDAPARPEGGDSRVPQGGGLGPPQGGNQRPPQGGLSPQRPQSGATANPPRPLSPSPPEEEAFFRKPTDGPLHALAFAWSTLPEGATPPADQERQARALGTHGEVLLEALIAVMRARALARLDLAAAYERLVALMLDTLQRRAAIGQQGPAHTLAWVEQQLGQGAMPPELRALFQRLKNRAAPAEDAELDRLRTRIRALRSKTVDQGCTEEEALAAAEKVADLLDRYGLSLSELELRHQPCEGFGIDTGRKRASPLDDIVPSIASFCDCRSWLETSPDKLIRHVFFGLPADTIGARYLYDVIAATVEAETAEFRDSDLYRNHPSNQRAGATRSFQVGMVHSIVLKLNALKQQRSAGVRSAHGRDLVPLKHDVVDDEMSKLGLAFQTRARRSTRVLSEAYDAGREAGAEFEVHQGVKGPGQGS